jgi:hypothetical protein
MLLLPGHWRDTLPIIFDIYELVQMARSADSLIQIIAERLQEFATSPEPSMLLDMLLLEFVADPAAEPAILGNDGDIVIAAGMNEPFIGIALTQAYVDGSPAYCTTCTTLLASLDNKGFSYQTWREPVDWQPEVFNLSTRFIDASIGICRPKECLVIRSGQAFEYRESGCLVVKVLLPDNIALQWAFDRTLGTVHHTHMSTPEATILVYLLRFLACHGNASSLESVEQCFKNRFHYIRWEAVKTYCSLDGPLAQDILEQFTADPHPELRAAAARTLAQSS